jgi:hypothetical protein
LIRPPDPIQSSSFAPLQHGRILAVDQLSSTANPAAAATGITARSDIRNSARPDAAERDQLQIRMVAVADVDAAR